MVPENWFHYDLKQTPTSLSDMLWFWCYHSFLIFYLDTIVCVLFKQVLCSKSSRDMQAVPFSDWLRWTPLLPLYVLGRFILVWLTMVRISSSGDIIPDDEPSRPAGGAGTGSSDARRRQVSSKLTLWLATLCAFGTITYDWRVKSGISSTMMGRSRLAITMTNVQLWGVPFDGCQCKENGASS